MKYRTSVSIYVKRRLTVEAHDFEDAQKKAEKLFRTILPEAIKNTDVKIRITE